MALVVAQEVPASSTMAVPHGPTGVGAARRRMREELRAAGVTEAVVDDAVLVLSELLSNSCRHARPLSRDRSIRAAWRHNARGELTISVTDGGGPTRPRAATPSVTARGGRGLAIISALAREWGVDDECRERVMSNGDKAGNGNGAHDIGPADRAPDATGVTVWAVLAPASTGNSHGNGVNGNGRARPSPIPFELGAVEDFDLR